MTYQVLARKWRPRNFSELVGQEHVERALVNALDNDRIHHAFLFTGTRGVGKTTIARILAKSLNCETNGISSNPCGVCSACVEIDEGRFVDLIEVDAASRTKVDETRELLDNVQYAPVRGRYKVYLIDEVHMLSKHSFNALLKTLEEPPPHIKFLLATTDPQKLPITVLSRCLQFSLKRLPEPLMVERIQHILSAENVEFENEAIDLIATAADGSLRDALSLVDQAIPFGNGAVRFAEVRDMLGTIDKEHVYDLLDALAQQNAEMLLQKVAEMDALAPDYAQVLDSFNDALQRMAIAKEVPAAVMTRSDGKKIRALSELFSKESIQLLYQIALHGRRDLYLSPTARGGFEMTMLRLLAFQPDEIELNSTEKKTLKSIEAETTHTQASPNKFSQVQTSQSTNAQFSQSIERSQNSHSVEQATVPKQEAPTLQVVATPTSTTRQNASVSASNLAYVNDTQTITNLVAEPSESRVDVSNVINLHDVNKKQIREQVSESLPELLPEQKSQSDQEVASESDIQTLEIENWSDYYQTLNLKGAIKQLAKHCVITHQEGKELQLMLDDDVAPMLSESLRRDLETKISDNQGFTIRLTISAGQVENLSPAQIEKAEISQQQEAAIAAIKKDLFVKELVKVFDASIDERSIKPINEAQ